jgi:hypothetical protein
MKIFKRILKYLLIIILIPISYLLIALILSYITVNTNQSNENKTHEIFLSTNGVHLDIILAKDDIRSIMLNRISKTNKYQYYAFGWGDENFYLNTPTWNDLTFANAFSAMILKSSTLIHLTRYYNPHYSYVFEYADTRRPNSQIYKCISRVWQQSRCVLKNVRDTQNLMC